MARSRYRIRIPFLELRGNMNMEQKINLQPMDVFIIYTSVQYTIRSTNSSRGITRIRNFTHSPLYIHCKSFFCQECQHDLPIYLSGIRHSSPELLDVITLDIICMVQRLFKFDDGSGDGTKPSNFGTLQYYELYLEVEFDIPLHDHHEVIEESMQQVRMVPASKEAVKTLLKKPEVMKEEECCVICMEEFHVDGGDDSVAGVSAMPCDHVFHTHCIVLWLQINHTCPSCRYPLPTAKD